MVARAEGKVVLAELPVLAAEALAVLLALAELPVLVAEALAVVALVAARCSVVASYRRTSTLANT
jgi:hypothetical protein